MDTQNNSQTLKHNHLHTHTQPFSWTHSHLNKPTPFLTHTQPFSFHFHTKKFSNTQTEPSSHTHTTIFMVAHTNTHPYSQNTQKHNTKTPIKYLVYRKSVESIRHRIIYIYIRLNKYTQVFDVAVFPSHICVKGARSIVE